MAQPERTLLCCRSCLELVVSMHRVVHRLGRLIHTCRVLSDQQPAPEPPESLCCSCGKQLVSGRIERDLRCLVNHIFMAFGLEQPRARSYPGCDACYRMALRAKKKNLFRVSKLARSYLRPRPPPAQCPEAGASSDGELEGGCEDDGAVSDDYCCMSDTPTIVSYTDSAMEDSDTRGSEPRADSTDGAVATSPRPTATQTGASAGAATAPIDAVVAPTSRRRLAYPNGTIAPSIMSSYRFHAARYAPSASTRPALAAATSRVLTQPATSAHTAAADQPVSTTITPAAPSGVAAALQPPTSPPPSIAADFSAITTQYLGTAGGVAPLASSAVPNFSTLTTAAPDMKPTVAAATVARAWPLVASRAGVGAGAGAGVGNVGVGVGAGVGVGVGVGAASGASSGAGSGAGCGAGVGAVSGAGDVGAGDVGAGVGAGTASGAGGVGGVSPGPRRADRPHRRANWPLPPAKRCLPVKAEPTPHATVPTNSSPAPLGAPVGTTRPARPARSRDSHKRKRGKYAVLPELGPNYSCPFCAKTSAWGCNGSYPVYVLVAAQENLWPAARQLTPSQAVFCCCKFCVDLVTSMQRVVHRLDRLIMRCRSVRQHSEQFCCCCGKRLATGCLERDLSNLVMYVFHAFGLADPAPGMLMGCDACYRMVMRAKKKDLFLVAKLGRSFLRVCGVDVPEPQIPTAAQMRVRFRRRRPVSSVAARRTPAPKKPPVPKKLPAPKPPVPKLPSGAVVDQTDAAAFAVMRNKPPAVAATTDPTAVAAAAFATMRSTQPAAGVPSQSWVLPVAAIARGVMPPTSAAATTTTPMATTPMVTTPMATTPMATTTTHAPTAHMAPAQMATPPTTTVPTQPPVPSSRRAGGAQTGPGTATATAPTASSTIATTAPVPVTSSMPVETLVREPRYLAGVHAESTSLGATTAAPPPPPAYTAEPTATSEPQFSIVSPGAGEHAAGAKPVPRILDSSVAPPTALDSAQSSSCAPGT